MYILHPGLDRTKSMDSKMCASHALDKTYRRKYQYVTHANLQKSQQKNGKFPAKLADETLWKKYV